MNSYEHAEDVCVMLVFNMLTLEWKLTTIIFHLMN